MNFLEKTYKDAVSTGKKAYDGVVGTAHDTTGRSKKIADHKDALKNQIDSENLKKFGEQDLLNADQDLFTPTFHNKKLMKEQEAMLSLFNARKDQVLAARATPGISQTRF